MSNYITINLKKISTKGEFENITHHNERTKEYLSKEERTNIDSTKTYKNIVLTRNNYSSYEDFLEQKKELIKQGNLENGTKHRMIREDSGTQLNMTIQATKEALSEEQHIQFLRECNQELKKYFGNNEIIESHIHLDETTPHLHIAIAFFDQELRKFNQKKIERITKN